MRNICKIDGCTKVVASNELCDTHRKRVDRHGTVEAGRPEHWGEASTHPLYDTWSWLKRNHHMKAWEDFWEFVKDVGERPTLRHTLARKNARFGYSKDNFYWRKPKFDSPIQASTDREYHNEYRKRWEKEDPRKWRDYYLKSNYGITVDQADQLWEDQGGICPISKRVETVKEKGKTRNPPVDHIEGTTIIRGVLISKCNRGLGGLGHNPEWLARAIVYLAPFIEGVTHDQVLDNAMNILQAAKGKENDHPTVKMFGNLVTQKEDTNVKEDQGEETLQILAASLPGEHGPGPSSAL